jgi:hypothetical protein
MTLLALFLVAPALTWAPIGTWTETTRMESFTVTANEWRVRWTTSDPDFAGTVWDAEKKTFVARFSGVSGSLRVRQSGRFYVSVANATGWTITAEQFLPPAAPSVIPTVRGRQIKKTPAPVPPPILYERRH